MSLLLKILFTLMVCTIFGPFIPSSPRTWAASYITPSLNKEHLSPITAVVKKEIRRGKVPGAAVIIGNQKKVLYRRAFGYRAVKPKKIPMTLNTVFDLASLTKVVATTTAVMQLAEKGKLDIEDQVAKYWPEFKENGKEQITVRELLTHYSGLRPDLPLNTEWSGYDDALKMIVSEKPVFTPGTHFIYSDINFIVLGEIVRRVSGSLLIYTALNTSSNHSA